MCRYIAYYRVSTEKQGRSGLGLESQQALVHAHINDTHEIIGEFVEIESGRNSDRPKLAEAIAMARKAKATLIIAKLDRLARNVSFIANLMDSGVEFLAADMPHANRMTIQLMAVFAEHEARMISERTKAALAAAKARGVKLGNLNSLPIAQANGHKVIVVQADDFAARVLPLIRDVVRTGVSSIHVVADILNQRGVSTRRGGSWHGSTVLNVVHRSGFGSLQSLIN